jgi:hypothetical protein
LGKRWQSRDQTAQESLSNHSHVEKAPSGRYRLFIVAHAALTELLAAGSSFFLFEQY